MSTGRRRRTGAVVAVVAHPDDEALIAGGTLALAAAAGRPAGVVALTRGELGPISDPALADAATLGTVRETELQASAAALGVDWACCLDHPDGELEWAGPGAAGALADVLRPATPVALLTFGEDGLYGHPDHVATRRMTQAAAALLAPERPALYEAAWPPGHVPALVEAARRRGLPTSLWGLEPAAFDTPPQEGELLRVDVRGVLGRKLAALRAHRTQLGADHVLTALPDDLAARFLGTETWRAVGPPGGLRRLADLLAGDPGSAGARHG